MFPKDISTLPRKCLLYSSWHVLNISTLIWLHIPPWRNFPGNISLRFSDLENFPLPCIYVIIQPFTFELVIPNKSAKEVRASAQFKPVM